MQYICHPVTTLPHSHALDEHDKLAQPPQTMEEESYYCSVLAEDLVHQGATSSTAASLHLHPALLAPATAMTNARRVESPVFCCLLSGGGELLGIDGTGEEDNIVIALTGGPAMAELWAGAHGAGVAGCPDIPGLGENASGAGVTTGGPARIGVLEGGT